MKRKLGLVMAFLILLLAFTTGLTTNAQAATVQTRSSSSDFYTLEKTCAVIDAYLHGTQPPTTTCAQASPTSVRAPFTEVRKCNVPGVTMLIFYNVTQSICFIETGYWGYRINNVDNVGSPLNLVNGKLVGTNGWILWYLPGYYQGTYYNLNTYNDWNADFTGTHVDITQIDPGAQHS